MTYWAAYTHPTGARNSAPHATFDEAKRWLIRRMLNMVDRGAVDESTAVYVTHLAEDINLEAKPFAHQVGRLDFTIYEKD